MTFARLAKLLAVMLVAAALWRARAPEPPARVAILALPGATADLVETSNAQARAAEIRVSTSTTGSAFWRRLLAADEDDASDTSRLRTLWSVEPSMVHALAVPARLFADTERNEAVEQSFLGGSSGALVEAVDITAGRLPAPYDRAVDAVSTTAATLRREEWSEWIPVQPPASAPPPARDPAAPAAEFQFTRYTDTTYFFSPAYIAGTNETSGSPFLRGLDRELRPLVAQHVIARAARRLDSSRTVTSRITDARALLVFDSVAEDAKAVFAPDSTPSAVLDQVRGAVAAQIGALRKTVGSGGLVVILGGPATTRQTGLAPWYVVVDGGDSAKPAALDASAPLDLEAARSMLHYVVGLPLDTRRKAMLPAQLVSRFPIRATIARATVPPEPPSPRHEWSAESVGSLPGALDSRN